jgi:hypothetical protein
MPIYIMYDHGPLSILIDGIASLCVIPSIMFNLTIIAFGFREELLIYWQISTWMEVSFAV